MTRSGGAGNGGRNPPRILVAGLIVVLLASAGVATWYRLFTTFAPYDDEGCFLITARAVAGGAPLYDEVHSLYGPAFALLHAGVHRVLGLPFDHRVARWKTLVVLLVAAAAGALLIQQATGSVVLAVAGGLVTLHHVEKFAAEPGHPQDLSLLVLLTILALGFRVAGAKQRLVAITLGAGLGLLAMLKLNLAVFVGVPLAVVLALVGGWRRAAWLAVAVCLVMGPTVAFVDLGRPAVWWLLAASYAGLVVTAAVAVARPPEPRELAAATVAIGVSATAVAVGFCGVTLALGTTPEGLLHGLVLQHRGYLGGFFVPPHVSWPALAIGVAASLTAAFTLAMRPAAGAAVRLLSGLAMVMVPAAAHLAAGFRELTSGLEDRGAEAVVLAFATPLVWLVVAPTGARRSASAGRLLLALAASLAVLGCYPVAGGQLAAATVLLPLIGLVLVADGLAGELMPAVRTAVLAVVLVLAVAGVAARLSYLPRLYRELEPLGLPGTAAIHAQAEEVERWRWLTRELAARADGFVFFPFTWNSLYLWTGIEPPTDLNFTDWPGVLTHAEQRRVALALDACERPHVVWYHARRLPPAWLAEPLAAHIRQHYRPVASYGPIDLLARIQTPAAADRP